MALPKSILALIFCFVAFGCMLLAFASPYWVESFEKADNRFIKCGLWEFCFNDYTFYKDYNGKRFRGCWYIFSDQYRPIWEWLSPPWFISVQVMISISLMFQGILMIFLILLILRCFPSYFAEIILLGSSFSQFGIALVDFIALVVFGVFKEDRQWVPRPDQNYLSWSYGFAVISMLVTLGAGVLLLLGGRQAKDNGMHDYPGKARY
ncbi:hypothetical protein ScPMuIL_009734 [Solemya velum]